MKPDPINDKYTIQKSTKKVICKELEMDFRFKQNY